MEANVSKYTNAVDSGKQAITQGQKRKGGRGMRDGWEYKKLGDSCVIEYGTRVVQKKDGGTIYPVYGGGGETFRMDKYNRENCLVVARFAMSRTCVRYVTGKFFLNDSGLSIKAGKELLQSYLNHHILHLNDDIYNLGKGAAQRNLDVNSFRNLIIAIPPLSTQLSIVSELDKINELIRLKNEQLNDYDKLSQSIFYEMFGDPVANDKKWDVESLGKVCDVRDGTHDSPQYLQESPYILITSKNLVNGKIDYSNVNYISEEDYIAINKRSQVDDGDIIMAMIGTIGNPIIVKLEERKFCIKNVALIKFFNESLVSNKYIHSLLNNDSYLSFIKSQNKGGTQKFVALGTIRKLPIPIPPLSFQQLFAQLIGLIEKQKAEVQRTIADRETVLASSMQYWFG